MALGDKLPPKVAEEAGKLLDEMVDPATLGYAKAMVDDPADEYELSTGTDPEPAPSVLIALMRARADMPLVRKRDRYDGGGTKFNFRGVDRVVNVTRPVLARHGIVIYPEVLGVERRDVPRKEGGKMTETLVRVAWHVYGPAGDELPAPLVVYGEAVDTADKSMAKALSVSWREMLVKLLHIATGDPDPDSVMIERGDDVDRGAAELNVQEYRLEALRPQTSHGRLNQMANDLQRFGRGAELVENEHGEPEKLGSMIIRLRNERAGGAK